MELLREINAAFADVPYPGDESLTDCHCGECRANVRKFVGIDWRTMTAADAASEGDAVVANLTPAAFRYFLPGLMRVTMQDDEDTDPGAVALGIVSRFTTSDDGPNLELRLSNAQVTLDQFTPEQRRAIAAFLDVPINLEVQAPEVLNSARLSVTSGVAQAYSQGAVLAWLSKRHRLAETWPDA